MSDFNVLGLKLQASATIFQVAGPAEPVRLVQLNQYLPHIFACYKFPTVSSGQPISLHALSVFVASVWNRVVIDEAARLEILQPSNRGVVFKCCYRVPQLAQYVLRGTQRRRQNRVEPNSA